MGGEVTSAVSDDRPRQLEELLFRDNTIDCEYIDLSLCLFDIKPLVVRFAM